MKRLIIFPVIFLSFSLLNFSCESISLSFTIVNNNASTITAITASSTSNASSIIPVTILSGSSYYFNRETLIAYKGSYLYVWVSSSVVGTVYVDGDHTYVYDSSGNFLTTS